MKRYASSVSLTIALCLTVAPPAILQADAPFASGIYVISPAPDPHLALEAVGAGTASGTAVDLSLKVKIANRQWSFTDTGGGKYLIQPVSAPGLALTVIGGASADGSPLDLETLKKDSSQLWSFTKVGDGIYNIWPQCATSSGLDDGGGGTSPGSKVDIYTDDPTDPHLQFTITPVASVDYKPVLPDGEYTVGPHDGTSLLMEAAAGASDPGTPVQGGAPNSSDSQKWIVTSTGDEYVTLQPANAKSLAMTVTGGGVDNGVKIVLEPLKPGDKTQKWYVIKIPIADGKGQFAFSPAYAANKAIDNPGGAKDPGAQMQIWDMDLNNTHLWWILKPVK